MIWVVYGQTFRATPQKLVDIAEPRIVNRNALYRKPPLFLWDKLVLVQFWGVLNSVRLRDLLSHTAFAVY